ncbi:MAG TPA: hypothetical protein VJR70_05605 [Stellaceae bacterium]|nr:hypothetical protein [Stellaceae bacterium]
MTGRSLWWHAVLLVSGLIYARFCFGFFPPPSGRLGGDYSYFLPLLLAGRYWIAANGPLAVPHFTPAFCGGLPFLANPQSIFYSMPQLLGAIVDPERAFFLTTVLFAWAGGIGMFLLLRQRFRTSPPAAALGGVVFLFNGFLLYRMAIGHVPYHAVGLLPLLCWALLTPIGGQANGFYRACAAIAGAAALLTYFVYGGAPHLIVPAAIAVIAVWLLLAVVDRPLWSFWPVGLAAGVLAAAAGAAKLAPALAFVAPFPRSELWIFPDFGDAASVLVRGLFLPWTLPAWWGKYETELGLGPAPLVLLVFGGCAAIVTVGR